jgi:hypothetical protein
VSRQASCASLSIIDPATLERLGILRPSIPPNFPSASGERTLPDEASRITQALGLTGGNVVRAARLLGMSRDAVRYRIRKYGITLPFAQFSFSVAREGPDGGITISLPARPTRSCLFRKNGTQSGLSARMHQPWLRVKGRLG